MGFSRRMLMLSPLAASFPLRAQTRFPDRAIRVVIGYPAGGGTDVVGRPIMQRLSEQLGVPVVVENRAGANGNIAMEHVARAEPDGYTIFMGDAGNLGITHALYPNLPFDTQRDFVGVAQLTAGPDARLRLDSRLCTRHCARCADARGTRKLDAIGA